MTILPLDFQIDRTFGTVRIHGLTEPLTTNSLPTNVNFVQWDGITNAGKLTYNDRFPVPEQFIDPTPYQIYVNQWIIGAAVVQTGTLTPPPALSLTQAKSVKVSYTAGIYSYQRQKPVSVTVSGGTFSWDASDIAVHQYTLQLASVSTANLIAAVNNDNTLTTNSNTTVNSLNSTVGGINANVGVENSNTSTYNALLLAFVTNVSVGIPALTVQINNAFAAIPAGGIAGVVAPGGTGAFMSGVSPVGAYGLYTGFTVPSAGPAVQAVPVGNTTAVTLTQADLQLIITAIDNQRKAETLVFNVKQAAINALATIVLVAAYDSTIGW